MLLLTYVFKVRSASREAVSLRVGPRATMHLTNRALLPDGGARAASARSMCLKLNHRARRSRGAFGNYQIATFGLAFSQHQLTDRADSVDDGRAGRVGHERRQRLQRTVAIGVIGERRRHTAASA